MTQTGVAVNVPELYAAHRMPLIRMAILLVDDQASAEDVVQDAFIGLHRNRDKIRDPQAALGYLRTSVVNKARSLLRRRGTARKYLRGAEPDVGEAADSELMLAEEHREVACRRAPVATEAAGGPGPALLVESVRGRDRRGAPDLRRNRPFPGEQGNRQAGADAERCPMSREMEDRLRAAFDAKASRVTQASVSTVSRPATVTSRATVPSSTSVADAAGSPRCWQRPP